MRTKCLIGVISLLLLLGLSAPVSAVWVTDDAVDDDRVAGYDIDQAMVEVYPQSADVEEYMTVCLKMVDADSLPGMLYFEFDVDNDADTGGSSSMLGIMKSCEPGTPGKIKVQPGIDVAYVLFLRDQSENVSTAWCNDCFGPEGSCSTRDQTCSCDEAPCYTSGATCKPGDSPCYLIGNPVGVKCTTGDDPCVFGLDTSCYKIELDCVATDPCYTGRIIGEWYATATASAGAGGKAPTDRGRVEMPLPKGADSDDGDCYRLPWRRMVNAAYAELTTWAAGDGDPAKVFDYNAAKDPANLKWQVSAWYDPDFGTTGNDFFGVCGAGSTCIEGATCAEVSDVVPSRLFGLAAAQGTTGAPCEKYQRLYHWCFNKVDNNNLDFDECKGYDNQTDCDNNGCYWYAGKSRCVIDVCQTDVTFDSKVTGSDLGVLKKEYGRMGCP